MNDYPTQPKGPMTLKQALVGEFREYADQIISVAGKTLTTDQLIYASKEDLYSTCLFPLNLGKIPANSQQQVHRVPFGQAGQGFTNALTFSETNNPWGSRAQGNEAYIAFGVGFDFYATSGAGSFDPIPLQDLNDLALAQDLDWGLQIGGGPFRVQGLLGRFPYGSGLYAAGIDAAGNAGPQNGGPNVPVRKQATPLVFSPNIDTLITIGVGGGALGTFVQAGANAIAVRCYLTGFRITLPA